MIVAVTGASGLLGGNLAIQLREAGHQVRCTRRGGSQVDHLAAFDLDWHDADLGDEAALADAFAGAELVFHCAASTSIRRDIRPAHIAANIVGTQNVLAAVRAAGVKRLVHTSSVVAVGVSTDGVPIDETAPWNLPNFGLDDGYAKTKRQSESLVLAAATEGLDAVIVNPSFMFGPYDAKQSSGRMILAIAKGRLPGYTEGTSNFVDVRDVARGMILAAEKGVAGQRYILGNRDMHYREAFALIAGVLGVRAPRFKIPSSLARLAGLGGDLWQRLGSQDADLNSVTVAYSLCAGNLYSSAKARRELGYEPGPIEVAVADAAQWFREQGMLR